MKCDTCVYDTDTQILAVSTVAEKLQLYGIHVSINHTQVMGGSATEDSRRKVKFPQPEIDKGESLEVWEMFLTQWEEYK